MKFYHGGNGELNFEGYGHSVGTGIWLTQNRDAAISYINPSIKGSKLFLVDVDLSKCKLITFDYAGSSWQKPPKIEKYNNCKSTDELVRAAKKDGYDAIMFKNVKDAKNRYTIKMDIKKALQPSTNIVITKKEQMKILDSWYYNELENITEEYFNY